MPISLPELNSYLCDGKLKLERHVSSHYVHYRVRLRGRRLGLPSILCISNSEHESDHRNAAVVALSLGLQEPELLRSTACLIGRGCVLLMLSWKLVEFIQLRATQTRSGAFGWEGATAMAESVRLLLGEPDVVVPAPWSEFEVEALERIREPLAAVQRPGVLAEVANQILQAIDQRRNC